MVASMGPRHRCRGIPALSGIRLSEEMLQWGRGIAAAESGRANLLREPRCAASMGPRHRCRGIARPLAVADLDAVASMGPRHRCRGIWPTNGVNVPETSLQWGRGIAAAEFLPQRERFFGARGFNGAAASLPRNLERRRVLPCDLGASMGPRHRCRGIALVDVPVFLRVLAQVASTPALKPQWPHKDHLPSPPLIPNAPTCQLVSSARALRKLWPTQDRSHHAADGSNYTTCACRSTCVKPFPNDSILLIGRPSVGPRSTIST